MAQTSFASSHDAINIFRNGAWTVSEHFWKFIGFGGSSNTYTIEVPGVRLGLTGLNESKLYQDFSLTDRPFDFQNPADGGQYTELPHGYDVRERTTLIKGVPITISFDLDVQEGDVELKFEWGDTGGGNWQLFRKGFSGRVTISAIPQFLVEHAGIRFRRSGSTGFSNVLISRWMLATGAYTDLPYTGDPFEITFPKGTIIMWLGDMCPPGFIELEEKGSIPAEWSKNEPGIKARKGNYPRHGAESAGTVLHTPTATKVEGGVYPVLSYEGFDGYLWSRHTQDPENQLTTDNATKLIFTAFKRNLDVDSADPHTHELSEEPTRPVSVGYLFCKRA